MKEKYLVLIIISFFLSNFLFNSFSYYFLLSSLFLIFYFFSKSESIFNAERNNIILFTLFLLFCLIQFQIGNPQNIYLLFISFLFLLSKDIYITRFKFSIFCFLSLIIFCLFYNFYIYKNIFLFGTSFLTSLSLLLIYIHILILNTFLSNNNFNYKYLLFINFSFLLISYLIQNRSLQLSFLILFLIDFFKTKSNNKYYYLIFVFLMFSFFQTQNFRLFEIFNSKQLILTDINRLRMFDISLFCFKKNILIGCLCDGGISNYTYKYFHVNLISHGFPGILGDGGILLFIILILILIFFFKKSNISFFNHFPFYFPILIFSFFHNVFFNLIFIFILLQLKYVFNNSTR